MIQVSIPLDKVIQWLKGTRMEVPPPSANLQASRGTERRWITWQVEPGGGWRSAGVYGKNFGFSFIHEVCFQSMWARDWRACLYQFLAELNEKRHLDERESFCHLNRFVVVFYCQCLIRSCRRKYSRINLRCFPASICSKELGIIIFRCGSIS